jgi:hypothetical protein
MWPLKRWFVAGAASKSSAGFSLETLPGPSNASSPRRRVIALVLKLSALAAAGGAQAVVATRPGLSLGGFALGMLLFIAGERLTIDSDSDAQAGVPAPRSFTVPRLCWGLWGMGCALCVTVGILVHRNVQPPVTHVVWLLGLLSLIAAGLRAWRHGPATGRAPRRVLASLVLLGVIAGGCFGWRVSSIPPEVHNDEAAIGNDAVGLLERRPFNLFTTGWYECPMLHALPAALGIKVFGINLLGLRAPSVVMGVGSVLLLFGLAYRLWGFEVALLSGLLLASARFFIHLSRTGYHYIGTPFFSVLVVWLFVRVWGALGFGAAVACGMAVALGMQGYYATRLVPVLLALTFLLWLPGSNRALVRARVAAFVVIVATALATAAPMIGYFAHHWSALWARTRGTSVFTEESIRHLSFGYRTHDLGQILLIQARKAVTLFNVTGDTSVQYGYTRGGLFEPVSAALFVLGCAVICAHPLRRRNILPLLWVVVPVVTGAWLTIDTPFFPRISGIVPFAVVIVALALHSVLGSLRDCLPRSAGRVAALVVAVGVLAAVYTNNIRSYFIEYAPYHRRGPAVDVSAWLLAHGAGKTTYMIGGMPGFSIRHESIRFVAHGFATADVTDLDAFLRDKRLDPATALFIIMPAAHDTIAKVERVVGPLDVREHRDIHGQIEFYTGIPAAARSRRPDAGLARFSSDWG